MAIMDFILPIVMLLAGLGFGGVAVWLLMRASVAAAFERGRREASAETAALSERLVAREDSIEELRNRLGEKDASLADLQRQVAALAAKAAQLNQSLIEQQNQAREKLALLDNAKQQLADAFKALAADALKSSNTSFLELAKTQLEKFQESAKGISKSGRPPSTSWSNRSRSRWARSMPSCRRSKRAASKPTAD